MLHGFLEVYSIIYLFIDLVRSEKYAKLFVNEKHIGPILFKLLVTNSNNEKLIMQTLPALRNLCVIKENCPILYSQEAARFLIKVIRFSDNQVVTFEAILCLATLMRGDCSSSLIKDFLQLELNEQDQHCFSFFFFNFHLARKERNINPISTLAKVSLLGSVDPEDTSRARIEAAMRGEDSSNIVFLCYFIFLETNSD